MGINTVFEQIMLDSPHFWAFILVTIYLFYVTIQWRRMLFKWVELYVTFSVMLLCKQYVGNYNIQSINLDMCLYTCT